MIGQRRPGGVMIDPQLREEAPVRHRAGRCGSSPCCAIVSSAAWRAGSGSCRDAPTRRRFWRPWRVVVGLAGLARPGRIRPVFSVLVAITTPIGRVVSTLLLGVHVLRGVHADRAVLPADRPGRAGDVRRPRAAVPLGREAAGDRSAQLSASILIGEHDERPERRSDFEKAVVELPHVKACSPTSGTSSANSKKWWMLPIVVILLVFGVLMLLVRHGGRAVHLHAVLSGWRRPPCGFRSARARSCSRRARRLALVACEGALRVRAWMRTGAAPRRARSDARPTIATPT